MIDNKGGFSGRDALQHSTDYIIIELYSFIICLEVVMGLTKQAKILSNKQIKLVILHLSTTRNPIRNRVIFLLSVKSGFRAKEIASLQWKMLMNSNGEMMNEIHLTNTASKGKSSGRVITIHKELKKSLIGLYEQVSNKCQSALKSFHLSASKSFHFALDIYTVFNPDFRCLNR